jgi:hypothetical protein
MSIVQTLSLRDVLAATPVHRLRCAHTARFFQSLKRRLGLRAWNL